MIPEKEQPYKLPDNWQWTTLGKIANWGSGGTPSRRHKEYFNGDIPWIKTGELKFNYIYDSEEKISLEALNNSSARIYPKDTVIIAMYAGNNVGNVAILGIEAAVNQACACAVCNSSTYFKYLFYYIIQQKNNLIAKARGSVQENISQEIIKNHPIPLPPVDEQIRIVEIIESLFAKLNRARAFAQKIVDGYELRRGKILYDAFNIKDNFQEVKLSDVVLLISGQDLKSDQYNESKEGIPCIIGASSFDDNTGILINRWTTTPTVIVKKDDILLTCKGTVGKTRIVDFDEAHIARQIMALRAKGSITSKFIYYFLQSQYKYLKRCEHGLIPGIKRENVLNMDIKLPPIEEQREIARRLDSLLTKEQRTKEFAEQTLQKIDLMKKTILARAFRGKL